MLCCLLDQEIGPRLLINRKPEVDRELSGSWDHPASSLAMALINYLLSPRPSRQCPSPPSCQAYLSSSSTQSCLPTPPCAAHPLMATHAHTIPALRRENGDSAVQDLAKPSVPVQGPFPSLSLPLFLSSPRRGQSARQGLRPPIPFSDSPAFIKADIQPRRHISPSNVLPTGGSSLNTSLSTIVSTRYPAYIAKSRCGARIRSQRL